MTGKSLPTCLARARWQYFKKLVDGSIKAHSEQDITNSTGFQPCLEGPERYTMVNGNLLTLQCGMIVWQCWKPVLVEFHSSAVPTRWLQLIGARGLSFQLVNYHGNPQSHQSTLKLVILSAALKTEQVCCAELLLCKPFHDVMS